MKGGNKLSQRESSYDIKTLENQLIKAIQQGAIQDEDGQLPAEPELMRQYHSLHVTTSLKRSCQFGLHLSGTW